MEKNCKLEECKFYEGDYPSICSKCARNYCHECPAWNSRGYGCPDCIYEDSFQYVKKDIVKKSLSDRGDRSDKLYDQGSIDIEDVFCILLFIIIHIILFLHI